MGSHARHRRHTAGKGILESSFVREVIGEGEDGDLKNGLLNLVQ